MTSSSLRRARRAQARELETVELAARVKVLEGALHAVWLWHTTDGQDLDALRSILLAADRDAQLLAALDRLVKST